MRHYDFCMVVFDTTDDNFDVSKIDLLRERIELSWEILNATAAGSKIVYVLRKETVAKVDQPTENTRKKSKYID